MRLKREVAPGDAAGTPMRRLSCLVSLMLLWPAAAALAQDSCDPCVDGPEMNRPRRDDFGRSSSTTVITADQMRALGIVSVADLVNQLPRSLGVNRLPQPLGAAPDAGFEGPAIETRHFRIQGEYDALALPEGELGALFDDVYDYVSARVGRPSQAALARVPGAADDDRILLLIASTAAAGTAFDCPQRGSADGNRIVVYADGATSRVQLLGVVAHEVGHVLSFRRLAELPVSAPLALLEGYATWAAGAYVTDWYGIASLRAAARSDAEDGSYVSILEPIGSNYTAAADADPAPPSAETCQARRDERYTQWGALVEFLIDEQGPAGFGFAGLDDAALGQSEARFLESLRGND